MIDTEQLKNDGYDFGKLAIAIENALIGLMNCKSKEAKLLGEYLEIMRVECEMAEAEE